VITRRALLAGMAAGGGLLGLGLLSGYLLRDVGRSGSPSSGGMMGGGGMMGSATPADMSMYRTLFNRHAEIRRTVEEIPGGVRTTTESDAPELASMLQAHVSSMYAHLRQGAEVTCMSNSVPTLFHNAESYERQLTLTPKGVVVTETSNDPRVRAAIRGHVDEVSGFVHDGMPAMMRGMMGG
jgi:hypothetical protein